MTMSKKRSVLYPHFAHICSLCRCRTAFFHEIRSLLKVGLGHVHMIPGQLIAPGQLTDPGVNFASVHGLTSVTVHMSFSLPRGNFERQVTRCPTPGNPPCRGNFSPCEQSAKVAPGARPVLRMLIFNVWNKFSNKKFEKAPEIGKRV